jgi:hypothetical protein
MKFHTLALALAFVSYTGAHCASVSAPSTEWTALQGNYDYTCPINKPVSPTSTSVSTTAYKTYEIGSSNYNYRPVDYETDGGTTNDLNPGPKGEPDYYLSVLVNFSDIVAYLSGMEIEVTDQSAMRFVSATSTQGNKLNQDIGGVRGDENAGVSWSGSGALTKTVTANGIAVVPEPAAATVLMLGSVIPMLRRRRQGT